MLSHLELARALERAVRRAQLPFAVSQGFSPHMRIAFGAALPVGVGGTAEIFDLFSRTTCRRSVPRGVAGGEPRRLVPHRGATLRRADAAASVALPGEHLRGRALRGSWAPSWFPGGHHRSCARRRRRRSCRPTSSWAGVAGRPRCASLEAKPTGSLRADAFARPRELVRGDRRRIGRRRRI